MTWPDQINLYLARPDQYDLARPDQYELVRPDQYIISLFTHLKKYIIVYVNGKKCTHRNLLCFVKKEMLKIINQCTTFL